MNEIYEVVKMTFACIGFVQTAVLLSIIVWTVSAERIRSKTGGRQ